jgi:hypothetical protein
MKATWLSFRLHRFAFIVYFRPSQGFLKFIYYRLKYFSSTLPKLHAFL